MEPRAESSEIPRRRFGIGDIMMLVVVAAVAASARGQFYWSYKSMFVLFNQYETARNSAEIALAEASVAWLAYLLLRPVDRARLRRGAPGLMVHLAVAVALGMRAIHWLTDELATRAFWDASHRGRFFSNMIMGLDASSTGAIAVSWATLAVVGRWRPEPAWDDRIGRLFALVWLILGPGEMLLRTCWIRSGLSI